MKRNVAFLKAKLEHEVPICVLVDYCMSLQGKSEKEQDEMRERFALEIREKYPLKQARTAENQTE